VDGRIGHLHCRFRLLGGPARAAAIGSRLERIARNGLERAYAEALEQALGDDQRVHVIRRLEVKSALSLEELPNDVALSESWSRKLVRAVTGTIQRGGDGAENLLSFPSQAAYVARFIEELLAGTAWSRWYFGAFRYLERRDAGEALLRVLLDNRAHLAAILLELRARGLLARVLAWLGAERGVELWRSGFQGADVVEALPSDSSDASAPPRHAAGGMDTRPGPTLSVRSGANLAADTSGERVATGGTRVVPERAVDSLPAALKLAPATSALAGDEREPRAPRGETSDAAALATTESARAVERRRAVHAGQAHDAEQQERALVEAARELVVALGLERPALLDRAAAMAGFTPRRIADWSDPRTLGAYVADVVEHWFERGHAELPPGPLSADFRAQLARVLSRFDWLDCAPVKGAIQRRAGTAALIRRRASCPTPRQRALSLALSAVVERHANELRAALERGAAELKVVLFALLVESEPQWERESLAARVIDHLVELAASLKVTNGSPAGAAVRGPGASREMRERDRALRARLEIARSLGDEALSLVHVLAAGHARGGAEPVACRCAGVLLVLRVLSDLRLPRLKEVTDLTREPDARSVWLLLLAKLANGQALEQGLLDGALCELAAPPATRDFSVWEAQWQAPAAAELQGMLRAMWRSMARQRLLRGERLCLHHVEHAGRRFWIAGDGQSDCWPLWLEPPLSEASFDELLAAWRAVYGRPPDSVTADQVLGASPHPACVLVPEVAGASTDGPSGGVAELHHENRRKLDAALRALDAPRLSRPAADLTLDLCAIQVLRAWARWLPKFQSSSVPYLLRQMLDREGSVRFSATAIDVELEPKPLDVVLELAGYTAELQSVAWLGGRSLRYRIRGAT